MGKDLPKKAVGWCFNSVETSPWSCQNIFFQLFLHHFWKMAWLKRVKVERREKDAFCFNMIYTKNMKTLRYFHNTSLKYVSIPYYIQNFGMKWHSISAIYHFSWKIMSITYRTPFTKLSGSLVFWIYRLIPEYFMLKSVSPFLSVFIFWLVIGIYKRGSILIFLTLFTLNEYCVIPD